MTIRKSWFLFYYNMYGCYMTINCSTPVEISFGKVYIIQWRTRSKKNEANPFFFATIKFELAWNDPTNK